MPSGIADYSYELLPLLAERADIDVVCPPRHRRRRVSVPRGIRRVGPQGFDPSDYDAAIYHLGNNPAHTYVYETALRHPGVAVFHDLVMHHLIAYEMVEIGVDLPRYERVMVEEYGSEKGSRLAELKAGWVATDLEKFTFPLTGHVARRQRGLIVHSYDSEWRIAERAPGVPVEVIPHHAWPPPREPDRDGARARLGLPRDAFIVGHFGFVTRPKQPAALVGGMAELVRERPDSLMVIVGPDTTGGGLQRILDRHGIAHAVRPVGYVDLDRFYDYVAAVDAVVNLRYPSAGESSGTLSRALAAGRAVIVNGYMSFGELPDDVALKVEIDRPQAPQLGAHLRRLASDPAFQARLEAAARSYAATELDPRRCADLYVAAAARFARFEPARSG
ncbi:MAG TPA: hypothetical protein VEA19_04595 [Actinomycetota bacterium]|nr:hypothetical protein [Actinomycetota bacterium]